MDTSCAQDVLEFETGSADEGQRLDVWLTNLLQQEASRRGGTLGEACVVPSRSKTAAWISSGRVSIDDEIIRKAALRLRGGMSVEVSLPPPLPLIIAPDETVRFGVLLEDEHILVIDKPAGLVVHPGAGQAAGTLVNGLLYYLGSELRQVGDALRPGIVHRLDKDTSGVMVVAKTDAAYQGLVRQFLPPRSISRRYLALVSALPKTSLVYGKNEGEELCGSIESAIGRDRKDRKKMTVLSSGGKQASTEWRIREALAHGFLLEVLIHTGRTHQIRVHLEQAAAPIVGDPIYGRGKKALPLHLAEEVQKFGRQALHAEKLSFLHPVCGGELSVESPLPEDMSRLVSLFNT